MGSQLTKMLICPLLLGASFILPKGNKQVGCQCPPDDAQPRHAFLHPAQMIEEWLKNGRKIIENWSKNGRKMAEKLLKNDWKIIEKWLKNDWKHCWHNNFKKGIIARVLAAFMPGPERHANVVCPSPWCVASSEQGAETGHDVQH